MNKQFHAKCDSADFFLFFKGEFSGAYSFNLKLRRFKVIYDVSKASQDLQ